MKKFIYSILFGICCILTSCGQKEYQTEISEDGKYVFVYEQCSPNMFVDNFKIFEIVNKETNVQYTILYNPSRGNMELIDKTEKN